MYVTKLEKLVKYLHYWPFGATYISKLFGACGLLL